LVIGTRGSALALAQVELFQNALRSHAIATAVEVRKIVTDGDRRKENKLPSPAGLKGLFTREIEELLLDGSIDVAVHSLKDLPGKIAADLTVAAVLERADPSDVLIAKHACALNELPSKATVATSSIRRTRQLRWLRPDLRVEQIRGNVPTRVEKLRREKLWDAIVLARAGLDRLGLQFTDLRVSELPILPAIGQGAIALQSRSDSTEVNRLLAEVNHLPTFLCIRAERELLRLLDGDCNLPIGVRATLLGERLELEAILFGKEDEPPVHAISSGRADDPETVARNVHRQLETR